MQSRRKQYLRYGIGGDSSGSSAGVKRRGGFVDAGVGDVGPAKMPGHVVAGDDSRRIFCLESIHH